MDTATGEVPISNPRAAFAGAAYDAVPDLGPGWVSLRNCALGGGGPRVGLVLLHPNVGVALVDFAPRENDAVGRFLRALDSRRFPAIFGGYPPVARLVVPANRLRDLDRLLTEAFETQPALALAGGDGWVRTARAAVESELPVAAPERRRAKRRRAFPWRPAVLAVVGAASTAALLLSASPERNGGNPAGFEAVVATAPVVAPDRLPEAASGDDKFTAQDVAAALTSAEPLAGVEAAPEPANSRSTTAAHDRNRLEPAPSVAGTGPDQPPRYAPPAAVLPTTLEAVQEPRPIDAGTGATAATGPQEAGGTPAATGSAEPPPAPVAAAVASPPAAGVDRSPRRAAQPTAALPDASATGAAVEPRSPPKRAAAATAPVDPPPRPAPQAAETGIRRAASPAAEGGGAGRCREILLRATMGEALSINDREVLRRGC